MATELQRLRELAKRRHDAATSKASRLNRQGVKISGTEYDPRVNRGNINRYTRKQLQSYINRLDGFTDRSNQYVAGRAGVPIPKQDYVTFQRAQRAHNLKTERYLKPHENRILPTTNVTVGQRLHDLDAKEFNVLRMGRGVSDVPFQTNTQKAGDFMSAKSMRAAEKAMRKKLERNHLPKLLNRYRRNANIMLDTIGEHDMIKKLDSLSDEQFDVLWNLTGFPSGIKLTYENTKSGTSAKWAQEIAHDSMLEGKELISWVENEQF